MSRFTPEARADRLQRRFYLDEYGVPLWRIEFVRLHVALRDLQRVLVREAILPFLARLPGWLREGRE